MQNESTMNLQPAPVLVEDRESEIDALEKELKQLEGDDCDEGDDDDSCRLDSSQTLSLSASMTKQLTCSENVGNMSLQEVSQVK